MKELHWQNIRARLTLGNILVFGGILVVYAFGTSYFFLTTLNHQLDESLKEELELVTQMLLPSLTGDYQIGKHHEEAKRMERFVEIWSPDGRLLYRSETLGGHTLGDAPDGTDLARGIRIGSRALTDGTRLRVASTLDSCLGQARFMRLAVNEAAYFENVNQFILVLIIGVPLALMFIAVSAYVMARRALKPIDMMVATARRIGSDNLKERLPVNNPDDELGRLATTFNDLLARVQQSFEQLKRFTSDASHELRTPLTAMRTVGEVGLQTNRTEVEYREVIGSMLEESSRLTRLVDSLLFLSRADWGRHELRRERFDLLEFAQTTAAFISVLADEKNQHLCINRRPGIFVNGDKSLLSQALLNLLDNAIKFSPEDSVITINVGDNGKPFLDVIDSGVNIPSAERERIFERFYRMNNDKSGTGLGLAIGRWAVEANGGTLTLENSTIASGNTFRITLSKSDTVSGQESRATDYP